MGQPAKLREALLQGIDLGLAVPGEIVRAAIYERDEMRETVPRMIKIIITGYPSLDNSIEAVNRGADGYIIKPYAIENLLRTIKEHLQKQKEAKRYDEKKVKEFIETRAEEHEAKASTKRSSK